MPQFKAHTPGSAAILGRTPRDVILRSPDQIGTTKDPRSSQGKFSGRHSKKLQGFFGPKERGLRMTGGGILRPPKNGGLRMTGECRGVALAPRPDNSPVHPAGRWHRDRSRKLWQERKCR